MVSEQIFIHSLLLHGFRAYLEPKTFDFSKARSLAIFAPNGKGKSSVIDALEFLFSEDGTLRRLGLRAINNQAGVAALPHNLAEARQINPAVTIAFKKGREVTSGTRNVLGRRPKPPEVSAVAECLVVDPIIRGHELRSFVESQKAEQRYVDVATWLQLGPFVDVQRNLRLLRQQVKAAAEDNSPLDLINQQLARETENVLTAWDDEAVVGYANTEILAPLDDAIKLAALGCDDKAMATVAERAKAEEKEVGLAGLRQVRACATELYEVLRNPESDEDEARGAIVEFEAAVTSLMAAQELEAEERGKAASSAFAALWKAAEPIFAEDKPQPVDCPLCNTPLDRSAAGNSAGVRAHISDHLAELADYAAAKQAYDSAKESAGRAQTAAAAALKSLLLLLSDEDPLKAQLVAHRDAVLAWRAGRSPDAQPITVVLCERVAAVDKAIETIEARQGTHTYAKAKTKLGRLIDLKRERELAELTQAELETLSGSLTEQSAFVSNEIRKKVQALLDTLQAPMNAIYRQIQGDDAVPIRLELPAEEDANQQRLNLVVDFAQNRIGVQPGGYLSDSQIHSLALALRLAAIKACNSGAPFVALDDVVTSYDADHRRTITAMLAAEFKDFQVIVTSHDERFFNYLKDQLAEGDWRFTRIIRTDPDYGPRFAEDRVTDEMIEARWAEGESAANEIRQAEEEWLLGLSRDFGVSVRIRPLERPYSYDRSELAAAIAQFLTSAKIEVPTVPGVNNRFLLSLQKGVIENFGSHFQDGPYGDGSIGDERARWAEFKVFRNYFSCPKCRRTRFKRSFDLRKPVCAKANCEAQFELCVPATAPEPAPPALKR